MITRIATLAYPIERLADFSTFQQKQIRLVAEAAAQGAKLILYPEYASMELTSLLPPSMQGHLSSELAGLREFWPMLAQLYRDLAQRFGITLIAPSAPEPRDAGYVNCVRIYAPSGAEGKQEKLIMTRFEREEWHVGEGSGQTVFETSAGPVGIAICYDSEFPLLVRRLVAAGARIILVPSCTDTLAGYHRVALSCRARALENQCFVVQASTVGSAPWSLTVDENHGRGAVYGPVDRGFAADGVISEGKLDIPGFTYADLSLTALDEVRKHGQVRNHLDWDCPAHLRDAEVARLVLN